MATLRSHRGREAGTSRPGSNAGVSGALVGIHLTVARTLLRCILTSRFSTVWASRPHNGRARSASSRFVQSPGDSFRSSPMTHWLNASFSRRGIPEQRVALRMTEVAVASNEAVEDGPR